MAPTESSSAAAPPLRCGPGGQRRLASSLAVGVPLSLWRGGGVAVEVADAPTAARA